jgi:hypothetical protein
LREQVLETGNREGWRAAEDDTKLIHFVLVSKKAYRFGLTNRA